VQATAENGNVYLAGSDHVRHLVCTLAQVTAQGSDPTTAAACLHDPSFALAAGVGGGWCYTTDVAVVGEACVKQGNPGTLRLLGDAYPPEDASVFPLCVSDDAPSPVSTSN
jgi:hypothetical protein